MNRYTFGSLLRKARQEKGMTVRSFADAIGYSAPYVSDVENGNRLPFVDAILPKIAELLELNLEMLQTTASASRQGGFLLPIASERHNEAAALLSKHWLKLKPAQLNSILRLLKTA